MNPLAVRRAALSRLLLAAGCIAALAAVAVVATGGARFTLAGARVSLTSPWRPALAAALCFIASVLLAPVRWRANLQLLAYLFSTRARGCALALAILTAIAGVVWGSRVGGGSDASGYLEEAVLWRQLDLVVEQPIAAHAPWPDASFTLTPLGFRAATDGSNTMVPTYAPGLPLLMASAQMVFGFCGAFLVVPLCGGLAVWLTFVLGRQLFDDEAVALWGALLVATSPAFLCQLMNPMNDVPVTTAWTLALVLLISGRPLVSGAALAVAIAIRPNLVPVALIPFAWIAIDNPRSAIRFAIGAAPAAVGIAAVNTYLYGSPFHSGYGAASDLYAIGNFMPNVSLYGGWLLQAETPLVALAVLFFVAPGFAGRACVRRAPFLLGGMIAGVVLPYLFYAQFDSWTYLRFFLPAWPIVMVLSAHTARAILHRVPRQARPVLATVCVVIVAWQSLALAIGRFVFEFHRTDRRYADVARFISDHTDARAVVISMQHSGSLRLYTGRPTLRYDLLDPQWLDRAIAHLISTNQHPYIVLDHWERDAFRGRFAGASPLGGLGWMPMAMLRGDAYVYVYDAATPNNALRPVEIPSTANEIWSCPEPSRR